VETNWKNEYGFGIRRYDLSIDTIDSSKTIVEQKTKIEKISLVTFLNDDQRKNFVNICRRLKYNDNSFYQNKNLHATLFGFGPLEHEIYERICEKIHQFSKNNQVKKMYISFDCVRPGATYSGSNMLRPVRHISNGTVIAYGDVAHNSDFCNYSNKLALFLLNDKKIKSRLGARFRRKLPSVWCTLGYYDKVKPFKISNGLGKLLNRYGSMSSNNFNFKFVFRISEIALVKSMYKNLRYPKIIGRFRI